MWFDLPLNTGPTIKLRLIKLHHFQIVENLMKRYAFILALISGMMVSFTNSSFAWDGQRKGFIIGIGAGGGLATYKPYTTFSDFGSNPDSEMNRENKFALMTDFKIGYAPSNQVALFWMSKVAWFGHTNEFADGSSQSYTFASGVGGLGVAYYFQPQGPSPYLTAGLGFSTFSAPFERDFDGLFGSGLALGAGYEFSNHWSVEGNFTWGSPNEEYFGDEVGIKTWAARVTINVLGY
ncbi:hypothetical protein EDS67_07485 [candidate division KSB1 bacterium]|nr:MAG: hypothetical protein EDS67_07485 [candidate division KSB1 bacterium]MBC6947578.1 hypothetical protein [candidate division KSB1 bacterium]MCE7941432.1 hypothetical protein [Chlorobi bacterium CHB1]